MQTTLVSIDFPGGLVQTSTTSPPTQGMGEQRWKGSVGGVAGEGGHSAICPASSFENTGRPLYDTSKAPVFIRLPGGWGGAGRGRPVGFSPDHRECSIGNKMNRLNDKSTFE